MSAPALSTWISSPVPPLGGTAVVPGDAAIAARALVLAALAVGESRVTGAPVGLEPLVRALRTLGAHLEPMGEGAWRVHGVGVGGLRQAPGLLDVGPDGLAFALLAGLLATQEGETFLTTSYPAAAFLKTALPPLSRMGAAFTPAGDGLGGIHPPLLVRGTARPVPVDHRPLAPVACEVKSALLLAALNVAGRTTVVEETPTADHTERLLRQFGAAVTARHQPDGAWAVSIDGQQELRPARVAVPGDVSLAGAALVAAALRPGPGIALPHVGVNEHRIALFPVLRDMGVSDIGVGDMGASLTAPAQPAGQGEPLADLRLHPAAHPLRGVAVAAASLSAGELALVAVAASCARGTTVLRSLPLRLARMVPCLVAALSACGVTVSAGADVLTITGDGRPPRGGATVEVDADLAPAFLALGTAAAQPIAVRASLGPAAASLLNALGAAITQE
ncbi:MULTISPECIES: 3-phosphoshikimate 1-carboxyvinyltransferase [Nitrospirillum]|uniref:3-phosphoshikimate 1-carboxyvinyltransferase n=1 Tax=Nitrospirillum amazonense TaxID=28077 RepID=A0A560FJ13_9PROT|nr:3-phosphoshikimate 1-carboxyvinyltransferase [Nitrospirillum amazonense]MEC4594186.1 3-phosphoshikimate 1-carboxyvinyltransferase [Nitrospirillum amazonense]TWB21585.1 3-phosphoshikimate 1-carboxyvinyltransferase [Nitrospirillum amazonense]